MRSLRRQTIASAQHPPRELGRGTALSTIGGGGAASLLLLLGVGLHGAGCRGGSATSTELGLSKCLAVSEGKGVSCRNRSLCSPRLRLRGGGPPEDNRQGQRAASNTNHRQDDVGQRVSSLAQRLAQLAAPTALPDPLASIPALDEYVQDAVPQPQAQAPAAATASPASQQAPTPVAASAPAPADAAPQPAAQPLQQVRVCHTSAPMHSSIPPLMPPASLRPAIIHHACIFTRLPTDAHSLQRDRFQTPVEATWQCCSCSGSSRCKRWQRPRPPRPAMSGHSRLLPPTSSMLPPLSSRHRCLRVGLRPWTLRLDRHRHVLPSILVDHRL